MDVYLRPFWTKLELLLDAVNLHGCVNGMVHELRKVTHVSLEGTFGSTR